MAMALITGSPAQMEAYKTFMKRCWCWGMWPASVIGLIVAALSTSPKTQPISSLVLAVIVAALIAPILGLCMVGFVAGLRWLFGH